MRTILIWDQCGTEPIKFAVLEGDYSHLNGVYVNSTQATDEECNALNEALGGDTPIAMVDEFPLPLRADDKVIVAGYLP